MLTGSLSSFWRLMALSTAALALSATLGLALAAAVRWYFRRPGASAPWGILRFFATVTFREILATTVLVTGWIWGMTLWISAGIALGLPLLATTLGVVFLAVAPLAVPFLPGIVQSWRKRARERRQYGDLIGQRLQITCVEEIPRAETAIACAGRWVVEPPREGPGWQVGEEIQVVDILDERTLRAERCRPCASTDEG